MTHRLWIAVLACTLAYYTGGSAYLVSSWMKHGHVPVAGWPLVISMLLFLWIAVGYVRFRLHEAGTDDLSESGLPENLGDLANVSGPGTAAASHK